MPSGSRVAANALRPRRREGDAGGARELHPAHAGAHEVDDRDALGVEATTALAPSAEIARAAGWRALAPSLTEP